MTEAGRHPPTGRLMGLQEIEKLLGVSRQRVHQLTQHPRFPDAFDALKGGRYWLTEDIEEWMRATGRTPTAKAAR